MGSNVKLKKRLRKIQQDVPQIQTILSSPIAINPIDEDGSDPKQLSKSVHRCQAAVTKEQAKRRRRPESSKSKRSTSVHGIRPVETKGGGSSSMNRIYCKPSRKESAIKPTASKIAIVKQPKKVLKSQKSSLQAKKSSITYIKKPRKRLRVLMEKSSTKDMKSLRHDCHAIEIVYENRKRTDKVSRLDNLHILGKLYLLITFGDMEDNHPHAEIVIHYVTNYLCNNNYLLSQLVFIMAEAEDLRTCLYTIKLLYQLVIKGWIIRLGEKSAVKTALGCPSILGTLIESMHSIHARFCSQAEYKEDLVKLHSHILQIIVAVCKTKSTRNLLKDASDGSVRIISKLTCSCQKSKDLANTVLEAVKIICVKKENSTILSSKKFFDGICTCYDLTHKIFSVPMILKIMSRVKPVLTCMSANERVINLLIDMISVSGRKSMNNKALLATLARIASESNGLKIISRNEMFYKLFHYFRKEEKHKHIQQRLGKIKAYSILNRAVNQIILPTLKLKTNLFLPDNVQKCLDEETVSDESEPENDDSEEDTDDDDDSDDADATTATDINSLKKPTGESTKSYEACTEELLTEMSPFYVESLLCNDETDYHSIFKFDIYEGIMRLTNTKIIENRIHRGINNDVHAYPDAVMLEPELDERSLNAFVNNFSRECMANKLKCSRGILQSTYMPRVVFDLDELHEKRRQPIIVPHPTTFVLNKIYDRTPANIPNSLKFESRFECGNLRKALQIDRYEYELLLTPDTNTTKGLQWFYFQVSNMLPGITYTFNIANFLKFNSQHNFGMQPLMFSVVDYTLNKTGWKRVGEEIIYFGNNYTDECGDKQYRTLLFSVTFPHHNDYVYFAYHYPYTFTRLMIKLFPFVHYKMDEVYARIDKLCTTVKTRNEIALLTITGAWNRANSLGIPLRRRPIVFITARVHPGETNASWIMEGIINFLLHPTDPDAVIAREHFIFKIIPMLNPEGVIYGNTRNGLIGSDLNRCWARPNKITCPEIYYVKRLIACAKRQLKLPVAAYIDIHGHSRKKYFFFYGCNPKMSWNKKDKAHGNLLDTLKILPEMVHDINPNIRLAQCKYKITKNRESTGRVVMWRQFDIKHSYTLECSYSFASDKQSVNTKILSEIGSSVITSLGKLAEKAYNTRKGVPSLALDYTYASSIRAAEKRMEERLKEGADESALFPLFVTSRVLQTNTVVNKHP